MSFGFGVTDVITISRLAWKVYKTCKDSSDDFKRISTEVASLHVILKETEEFLGEKDNGLTDARQERLQVLLESATDVLHDLDRLLVGYDSLGTHSQRTWDRLRWGLEDIADVRSRLISVNTTFAAFNSCLANSSQARIEVKLEKFIAEVRAGFREGSVVSSKPSATLDDAESWNELQRELEDIGLSAGMVSEHQEYIKSWFKDAIDSGILLETLPRKPPRVPKDTADTKLPSTEPNRSPNPTTPPLSLSPDMKNASISSASTYSPSQQATLVGSPNSSQSAEPFQPPSLIRRKTLPQDIDALLSHEEPPFPDLPPPTRTDTMESYSPSALLRKPSMPSLLLYRIFQKDTRLIEAASDGSLERVATLLSRGANVNVRDKWGWTALSMAAYGGHDGIAKLLLACGADTESTDVDGDSPLDLATNRGNAGVVIAIEEERANRAVRGMPEPVVKRSRTKTRKASDGSSSGGGGGGDSPAAAVTAGLGFDHPKLLIPSSSSSSSSTTSVNIISPLNRRTTTGISPTQASKSQTTLPLRQPDKSVEPLRRKGTMDFGPHRKKATVFVAS
ncbi:MAG: hypothetical protein M1825_000756 [Sarcosagium campestre]|nr:MAG: hypothetical protein M1825_000756 [Sarcosagium campestre]